MLVFWNAKLVMLSVPKTGTTAYETALSSRAAIRMSAPPDLKHLPLLGYQRRIAPLIEIGGGKGFELFAVVRNPVDWLGSWYRYRHRDEIAGTANSTRGVSFDDFVAEYLQRKPKPFARVGHQSYYVFTEDSQIAVKHLYKYENQPQIRAFLEQRFNMTLDLPALNPSPQMPLELDQDIEAALHFTKPLEYEAWKNAK